VTNFVYNGQRIIEERVAGLTSAQYIYGLGVDEVLWSSSAQSYYYLTDGLGSVRQITDATGIVLQWYNYDVFGAPTVANPVNQSRFEFAGREYDPETGLYHYRARAYSPVLGRYLQRDPIGFADDYNLYRYVKNNPINFTDPSGLEGAGILAFQSSINGLFIVGGVLIFVDPGAGGALVVTAGTLDVGIHVADAISTRNLSEGSAAIFSTYVGSIAGKGALVLSGLKEVALSSAQYIRSTTGQFISQAQATVSTFAQNLTDYIVSHSLQGKTQ